MNKTFNFENMKFKGICTCIKVKVKTYNTLQISFNNSKIIK